MRNTGASFSAGQCKFTVWAPEKDAMQLVIDGRPPADMLKDEEGYFELDVSDIAPGARYRFAPAGGDSYPDPASHFQPDGVHGASAVVDHEAYRWSDAGWKGLPLQDLIFYEVHTGTFTPEGTFEGIISKLDYLSSLGVNAIELMPVSQFPGGRNWGYDMVFPYAVQHSYGGPDGLKALVDAAHAKGIAVFLDVIFNHLGPEGNYLPQFGPYFTDQYCTPWGNAINFDGEWSDGVRAYFCQAVMHWYEHYHLDGLRVDAVHMMFDNGAVHFWELVSRELNVMRQRMGRNFYLIAESDLNSPHVVKSPENGGWDFDVQWLDDFHHALYVLLDESGRDRYEDFGSIGQWGKAFTDGFVHSGEYVRFRKRRHGASSAGIPGEKFLVFNQNHDQVGNRVGGERLSMLVSFERQKLAAAAILLAPYLPMLFMGEEYGAQTPFFYFVSHSDEELIQKVVEGRRKEFENYKWEKDPPNPQDETTFQGSKLDWSEPERGEHAALLRWHRALIALRKTHPALRHFAKNDVRVNIVSDTCLVLHRRSADQQTELACIFNLGETTADVALPGDAQPWITILNSRDADWNGESKPATEPQEPAPLQEGKIAVQGLTAIVCERA
ncbi:malto-oligosyltrehalose trehalohydrolase [Dyadobacter fermentans]|uniref:Malto-oligosyltrehalose trehalohydrolase n=1 Tax=Dyadobacter fermentans (strain ATCC 700827 / DSM 18053 / CIP 107007 / KCTC 52180 / NS114) TaxID=471854 RepID=C6VRN3_DYAFD|nr:malto-oligosyltrehalose trehalohydrolase [Dyadobacter fermentans]ACT92736.1 malto-oligosyltrehalose trehalohydrolase [Dyadobacter fermentans DSM 18053]